MALHSLIFIKMKKTTKTKTNVIGSTVVIVLPQQKSKYLIKNFKIIDINYPRFTCISKNNVSKNQWCKKRPSLINQAIAYNYGSIKKLYKLFHFIKLFSATINSLTKSQLSQPA